MEIAKEEKIRKVVVGSHIRFAMNMYTMKPSCDGKDGHWACMTHEKEFENQFQKDTHIHTGKHLMAWVCLEHGFEQP